MLIDSIVFGLILILVAEDQKNFFSMSINMDSLANFNNPLLSKLAKKAPGTFNHSIHVSELAAAAGVAIGIKSQYLRIGAYYHDIGKLKTPLVYIENKHPDESKQPVENLAQEIIDHVKIGVKIAKKSSLPKEIIQIIREHHGTSKIASLKDSKLAYPGPKPQSKLTGIMMLADCVEAKSRGLRTYDSQTIEKTVSQEIKRKTDTAQLCESGLSGTDIGKISQSLEETLLHIYHRRKYAK